MSTEDNQKKHKLEVHIDDTAMKEMAQEIAQKKVENEFLTKGLEGAEEAQKFFDETKQRLAQDYAKLGLTLGDVSTKADLDSAIANLVKLRDEARGAPSGTAPMNDAQLGRNQNSDLKSMKFESHEAMVSHLRELEQNGTQEEKAEAKQVLDALWRKTVEAMKNGQNISYGSNGDNPKSEEGKSAVQVELTGSEKNDPNSELQRYLARCNERERQKARERSQNYYLETEAEAQRQKERQKKVS
ncbi:MAG: hypothetical protein ABSB89_09060 [Candidatus Bathyarchaeia archaeon]|jgi:hypothetical protein